jgi:thiosulfate/3-mercaptopyruvate sulfurtransferase
METLLDLTHKPLVEAEWLADHLTEPALRIVDLRWRSDGSGRDLYRAGHIPGAVYLDWERDLTYTRAGVRYLLLPPERFAAVMSAAGIGDETRVVAYAETDHSGPTRLWWALKYYGRHQVAVLNGGLNQWLAEARPLTTDTAQPPPARFTAQPQPDWLATAAEIEQSLNTAGVCLVDTRPPEQYAGRAVWTPDGSLYLPVDQDWVELDGRVMRGGRIPGAINQYAALNLEPQDNWRYLSPERLRQRAMAANIQPEQRVITYCGSGNSATLGLFALYLAGYRNLALYDASWEEWGVEPDQPIERGE